MPASAALKSIVSDYGALNAAWKKRDLKACGKSLDALKTALTHIAFLPTQELSGLKQVRPMTFCHDL